jgi:glutathione synthase/RimK-type ligase-like ATP-grasp enzyme
MKIAVLDLSEYCFIRDVMKKLEGAGVEFFSSGEEGFQAENKYRVIIDRLSFQDPYLRQAMLLASLKGTYVINNPFASVLNNKIIQYRLIDSLGVKQPKTIMLPRINCDWELGGSVREPDWDSIRRSTELPCVLKPHDGFAWDDVYVIKSFGELRNVYDSIKHRCIMLLQENIDFTDYFRVFCINKRDVYIAKWTPKKGGIGEYAHPDSEQMKSFGSRISDLTVKINKLIDFDFNAVEWCVDSEGDLYVIDAMNEVPDIDQKFMPDDCYFWIVDRFCECVMDKLNSGEKNRVFFETH